MTENQVEPILNVTRQVQGKEKDELEYWLLSIRRLLPKSAPVRVSFSETSTHGFRVSFYMRALGRDLKAGSEKFSLIQAIQECGAKMLKQVKRTRQKRRCKRRSTHLRFAEVS